MNNDDVAKLLAIECLKADMSDVLKLNDHVKRGSKIAEEYSEYYHAILNALPDTKESK